MKLMIHSPLLKGNIFVRPSFDERFPVACHGEPLVEGSKGEPPPWSQGGVSCPPEKGRQGDRVFPVPVGRGKREAGSPSKLNLGPFGII